MLPSAYIKKNNNKYYVWLDSHNKLKIHEIQVGEYDENLDEYEVRAALKQVITLHVTTVH